MVVHPVKMNSIHIFLNLRSDWLKAWLENHIIFRVQILETQINHQPSGELSLLCPWKTDPMVPKWPMNEQNEPGKKKTESREA